MTVLAFPLGAVLALGCDSGGTPDAAKTAAPAAPAAPVKTAAKKGGKVPRRPVEESKKFNLAPGDD
jgi:hypothetical protein